MGGMGDEQQGQDFNLDQIVGYENIGKEYIVVKGNGSNISERPLVIATQDNTDVFVNDEIILKVIISEQTKKSITEFAIKQNLETMKLKELQASNEE